jgi:ATP-dependent RNA helicase RhlE
MERVDIPALAIHGAKDQNARSKILGAFRANEVRILVATDVSARGIDIPDVTHVVNYDMPEPSENYVHRVGRTGRGMRKGYAISFCSQEERPVLKEIESYLGQLIERLHIDRIEYEHIVDNTKDTKGVSWKKMIELEIKQAEENNQKYGRKKKNKKTKKNR